MLESLGLTEDEIASLVALLSVMSSDQEPFEIPVPPAYELRTLGQN